MQIAPMKNSAHLWLVSSSVREPSHVQDPESRSAKKQQAQHLSRDLDGLATVSQLNMEHFKASTNHSRTQLHPRV